MPSIDDILKMAGNVQNQILDIQKQLDTLEVEGVSGGGLVKIRATAKGRIIGTTIDESLLQPGEKTMLEDLIVAAINDARAKADTLAAEKMGAATQGMPFPPGFSLPGM